MDLKIKKPPAHNIKVICVAGELLSTPVDEINFLTDGENMYKVDSFIQYKKTDAFPGGLMYLATGQKLDSETVWSAYKNSERLVFFIVELVK